MNGWIDGQTYGWMDGWMDVDGWVWIDVDDWMDGCGWMDGFSLFQNDTRNPKPIY